MNRLLEAMKEESTHALTENFGKTYSTTKNGLMDLFALGGAYRSRTDDECVDLFMKAFHEDPSYAMKCLFYLRDITEGQGERRFFRVVMRYLAIHYTEYAKRNMKFIPLLGRWDDMYTFVDTPLQEEAFTLMKEQITADLTAEHPSLLAKWLKSENSSSPETKRLGTLTRKAFGLSPRTYRRMLSTLRERIRIVERLMSANKWSEIEYDKIPSRAGLQYRAAFKRHDVENTKAGKRTYEEFAKDENTTVNAKTLYPCDVVRKAININDFDFDQTTERAIVNKYWDNLTDYFKNSVFDGVAVVDTSSSMKCDYYGRDHSAIKPIDVAISLGLYCGEKCNPASPWYGHYITFSSKAQLVPIEGDDFVSKVKSVYRKNLMENTNIRSVFDLLLKLGITNHISNKDMPKNIIIISDMEFDECATFKDKGNPYLSDTKNYESEMEAIAKIWQAHGFEMPHLIFWNVDARQDNIPMKDNGRVTFISGYSPILFQQLMSGKSGLYFVLEKLDSERYKDIH